MARYSCPPLGSKFPSVGCNLRHFALAFRTGWSSREGQFTGQFRIARQVILHYAGITYLVPMLISLWMQVTSQFALWSACSSSSNTSRFTSDLVRKFIFHMIWHHNDISQFLDHITRNINFKFHGLVSRRQGIYPDFSGFLSSIARAKKEKDKATLVESSWHVIL